MLSVRLDRYETVRASMAWKATAMIVLGVMAVVAGGFLAVLGFLMIVVPDGDMWSRRGGFVVGLFFGVLPLAIGSVLLWRGIIRRIRLGRLRSFVAYARSSPIHQPHDLVHPLGMSPRHAELVVADAVELGIVDEVRQPAFGSAPPARGPSTAPAAPYAGQGPFVAEAQVGMVLADTYAVEGLLGVGGMGAVYTARHLRTQRRYAIKTLLPDTRLSPEAIARFEREALAASSLGHPNIVSVHDFNVTPGGLHYMVMDLLDGETLDRRLAKVGVLHWAEARARALELASALGAAHARGLLHRDLKPANVFLAKGPGAPERAVVLDFGLVKELVPDGGARLTASGAAVGTPMYMPPEQARGEPVDVRSDVYGLAAVVFEMVTGAPPFFDQTLASVYAKLLTTQAPAASSLAPNPLPPAFDRALAQALAKQPSDRFVDMAAFARALETA